VTDGDLEVVSLLRRNCKAFGDQIQVEQFAWGGPIVMAGLDLVIASDVVFDESNHPALLESLSSAPRLVLTIRKRNKDVEKRFLRELGSRLCLVQCVEGGQGLDLRLPVNADEIVTFEYKKSQKSL